VEPVLTTLIKIFDFIANVTEVGIVVIDKEGYVVFANDYFSNELCTIPGKNLINKKFISNELIPKEIKNILSNNELLMNKKETRFYTHTLAQGTSKVTFRIIQSKFN